MIGWESREDCILLLSGDKLDADQRLPKSAAACWFALHSFAALIVSPMITFVAVATAVVLFNNSSHVNSVLNAGGPANPLLWVPGLLLGLLVNRLVLKRAACWVWLAGTGWMACGIFAALGSYRSQYAGVCSPLDNIGNEFFSMSSGICGNGIHVMSFTLPLLCSIAYSIGAWISMRFFSEAAKSEAT